jgi:hypothetical protein
MAMMNVSIRYPREEIHKGVAAFYALESSHAPSRAHLQATLLRQFSVSLRTNFRCR